MAKKNGSIAATLAKIDESRVRDYALGPIPSPLDGELADLLRRYRVSTKGGRERMSAQVDSAHSYGLLAFAERMAALAVRERSKEPIRDGLLAIAFEGFRIDEREDILVMSLLDHGARKIKANATELFDEAAKNAPPEVARALREFAKRPAALRDIGTMGYRESDDGDGFRYVRTW
jgi:hypothetical protein